MKLRLLLSLLLLPVSAQAGGPPVDLTEYLAPRAEVGDYKVWKGQGIVGTLREDVVAVADVAGGGYRIERVYSDIGVEVARSEQLVTPGVEAELRWTDGKWFEGASLLGLDDTWPLSLREGKRARYRSVYVPPFILPRCCYETVTTGSHRFVGFADWVDSRGAHAPAAALRSRATTRSRRSFSGSWTWVWSPRVEGETIERGFVEGVGLVGATAAYRTLRSGVLTERSVADLELVEAVVQGVPYPPQD